MKPKLHTYVPLLVLALVAGGCSPAGPVTRSFEMSDPDISLEWVITRDHELACGAPEMAGGAIDGEATFGELGLLDLTMSAAWDIGAANPNASEAEYEPESPDAGGPFAPVLGQDEYPYQFQANPFTMACEPTVSATGELELSDSDGDQIVGLVTGGETHRLDVATEGDGIEVFAEIEFDGGTGKFADASGSAVLHLITHFDAGAGQFVIDEVGVLPDGTIRY